MNEIFGILAVCAVYSVLATARRIAELDYYLNTAQAVVDASRCVVLFDQIDCNDVDSEACIHAFDLPFIDLTVAPCWWPAIWEWDFIGRSIVMEHAASCMQVQWPEFDSEEF